VASGKAHLEVLPDGEPRDRLGMIADYVLEREH